MVNTSALAVVGLWLVAGLIAGALATMAANALLSARVGFASKRCGDCASWPSPTTPAVATIALLFGARCPSCGRWRPRWPVAVELGVAAVFGLLYLRHGNAPETVLAAAHATILTVALVTDARRHLIFNVLTYPAMAFAAVSAVFLVGRPALDVLAGGALAGGILLVLSIIGALTLGRGAIGMGDVKLGVYIGLITGFAGAVTAVTVGIMFGGLYALALLLLGRSRRATMPYGPPLIFGALFTMITLGG